MNLQLHLFNPDHDLALANGDPNFTASAAARQLAADLALLPIWFSGKRNGVLAPSPGNLSFLQGMRKLFPSLGTLLTEEDVKTMPSLRPRPWGWNPAICKRLKGLGIAEENMPDEKELTAIRENSHRKQAAILLKKLQLDDTCCGESLYLDDIHDIKDFVESKPGCILKAPLSGSGKGLTWCRDRFTPHIEHWCQNIINQQGGVMAEPIYYKALDFAMEFRAEADGTVHFAGYSLFTTKKNGTYIGNVLLSDEMIELQLTLYFKKTLLENIQTQLKQQLSRLIAGSYEGYLGVDMMICEFREPPIFRLHPCVEINLRMNMGMAARILFDNYVVHDAIGDFKIDFSTSSAELRQRHIELAEKYPLTTAEGRVVSGYLPLVPITKTSKYISYLTIL